MIQTYSAHSSAFPEFWFSRMARINCLFSSRYCKNAKADAWTFL